MFFDQTLLEGVIHDGWDQSFLIGRQRATREANWSEANDAIDALEACVLKSIANRLIRDDEVGRKADRVIVWWVILHQFPYTEAKR